MDTRFWGPSGWALLHLITATPIDVKRQAAVKEYFELLEYTLPCKFCRASFHDYIELQPLTQQIVASTDLFSRWLYDIHNRVNAKLRGQGLLTTADPPYGEIKAKYKAMQKNLCATTPLLGWDFLTSVAFSTPDRGFKALPMADTPENCSHLDLQTRNRYNLLTRNERIAKLKRWWALIPAILPCSTWRDHWTAATISGVQVQVQVPLQKGHEAMMKWLYRIEEQVCAGLRCPTPHPSLPAMKKEASAFESNCGRTNLGKTCRTRKVRQRRQAMSRRVRRLRTLVAAAPGHNRAQDTASADSGA